jgi:peptidoglycan-associated lipoprotein
MTMRLARSTVVAVTVVLSLLAAACGGKKPPVARPAPPPPPPTVASRTPSDPGTRPPPPPELVAPPPIVPPEPIREDSIASGSLDEINRNSPLKPLLFEFDSSDITPDGRAVLEGNAMILKRFPGWTVTIEGHSDERGTAEYNLALGERRAVTARAQLIAMGVSGDRLRTVSYGKEFPFDPAHSEDAYATNRRAHFVVTAK